MDVYRVVRAMLFIDGNNLFHSASMIGRPKGLLDKSIRIKFPDLPYVFAKEINKFLPDYSVYPSAVHYVASVPVNFSQEDTDEARAAAMRVEKQRGFYGWLATLPAFRVKLFEIDFRGHPVRRQGTSEYFEPKESKVDMEVAAMMLENCYRNNYDIAILVAGDSDYTPAVRRVINEGKQVAVFGIRNSCSQEFASFNPELTTWPVIWIDDLPEVWYRQQRDAPTDNE